MGLLKANESCRINIRTIGNTGLERLLALGSKKAWFERTGDGSQDVCNCNYGGILVISKVKV